MHLDDASLRFREPDPRQHLGDAGLDLGIETGRGRLRHRAVDADLERGLDRAGELTFLIVVFSFLIIDVFDNAGTLIGVAHRAGLLDKDGNLPRMKQALIADRLCRT